MKIKNTISTRSYEAQKILFKNAGLAEILIILELSLFHADKVQGKNWVFRKIVSYINWTDMIATLSIVNPIQIKQQTK